MVELAHVLTAWWLVRAYVSAEPKGEDQAVQELHRRAVRVARSGNPSLSLSLSRLRAWRRIRLA